MYCCEVTFKPVNFQLINPCLQIKFRECTFSIEQKTLYETIVKKSRYECTMESRALQKSIYKTRITCVADFVTPYMGDIRKLTKTNGRSLLTTVGELMIQQFPSNYYIVVKREIAISIYLKTYCLIILPFPTCRHIIMHLQQIPFKNILPDYLTLSHMQTHIDAYYSRYILKTHCLII